MEPRPLGRGMRLIGLGARAGGRASMEPRPLGRGMRWRYGQLYAETEGFNGATTSRSWNAGMICTCMMHCAELQWSHDLSVVE